jgi:hypothetical protein
MKYYLCFVTVEGREGQKKDWDRIAMLVNSPIVHTFAYFEGIGVYETTVTKFKHRTLKERQSGTNCIYFEVLAGDATKALAECEKMLGIPYDYLALYGLGVWIATEHVYNYGMWPAKWLQGERPPKWEHLKMPKNHAQSKAALWCGESMSRMLKSAGAPTPYGIEDGSTFAHVLYQHAETNRVHFKLVEVPA